MTRELKIGVEAKSRVTGFRGIVTGRCEYMSGCVQWLVTPPLDKDRKPVDAQWIDTVQLEVVGEGLAPKSIAGRPGGPRSDSPPANYKG